MADIARPFVTDDDPDRCIRCQDALQAAFRDLVAAATDAGWSEREVLSAIADLAENHLFAMDANANSKALIALLRSMT